MPRKKIGEDQPDIGFKKMNFGKARGFTIKIMGRLEGGRRTRRTLTTDNAAKNFFLKPIVLVCASTPPHPETSSRTVS
jgi:hypothetical protein